jgi:diadenosine tetraphosphatase ApaH/serine/threonine PP2A family protein phosphatase
MTAEDNLNYMQKKNIPLCFHGHSHMQGIYARDHLHSDHHLTDQNVKQSKYQTLLVCPGSVGQPRDGNPNAQCAIYDQVNKEINFFSLPYSVNSVVQRMKDYNLPEQLWQRLLIGK